MKIWDWHSGELLHILEECWQWCYLRGYDPICQKFYLAANRLPSFGNTVILGSSIKIRTNNQKQPRKYDAVKGAETPPLSQSAVLGGIEAVKIRLNSSEKKVRLNAVAQAMKYGDAGLNLVIRALKHECYSTRKAAINCLWKFRGKPKVKQALIQCHAWSFFECLYPSTITKYT